MEQPKENYYPDAENENQRPPNPYLNPYVGNGTPPQSYPTPNYGPASSPYAQSGSSYQNPYSPPPGQDTYAANPYSYYTYGEASGYQQPTKSPYGDEAFGRPAYQPTQVQSPAAEPNAQQRVLLGLRFEAPPRWTYIFLSIIGLAFLGQIATGAGLMGYPLGGLMEGGAAVENNIRAGEWWRLVTPIFLHFGLLHILFNAMALFAFGAQLEQLLGSKRFVAIFLLAGIGGTVLTLFAESRNVVVAGASGSVFGLLGALIAFFYRNRDRMGAWGQANLRNLYINAGLNFVFTITIPGIAIYGHLGGFVVGLGLGYFLSPLHVRRTIGAGAQTLAVRARDWAAEWWSVGAAVLILAVILYLSLQGSTPPFVVTRDTV